MTASADVSKHDSEEIPEPPSGWTGGALVHTGGNIYAREWIHPEGSLRVGYPIPSADTVAIEEVELIDEVEESSNPLNWRFVQSRGERTCEGEDDCLQTAMKLMENYSAQK